MILSWFLRGRVYVGVGLTSSHASGTFVDCSLLPELAARLSRQGISQPTEVQQKVTGLLSMTMEVL